MQRLRSEILVKMQRDLAVRAGTEAVSRLFEFAPDRLKAVELAVDDDPRAVIFAGDRLVARRQVNDTEPGMTQRNPPIGRNPMLLCIRPAVMEALGGALNDAIHDRTTR